MSELKILQERGIANVKCSFIQFAKQDLTAHYIERTSAYTLGHS